MGTDVTLAVGVANAFTDPVELDVDELHAASITSRPADSVYCAIFASFDGISNTKPDYRLQCGLSSHKIRKIPRAAFKLDGINRHTSSQCVVS